MHVALRLIKGTIIFDGKVAYQSDTTMILTSITLRTLQDYGTGVRSVNWSPDNRYLALGGDTSSTGHEKIEVYKSDYVNITTPQSLTNSMVLGDSAKGSAYDAHLRLMPGASVNLTGRMLYDNVS
jgi:hypothetical protein